MENTPSDSVLIKLLQKGDLEALGVLYDRHKDLVYRTALVICTDAETAADLLQDVFLRLHRFASNVDPDRPLEPWLYRMTANLAYTWIKRRRRWLRPLEDMAEWIAGNRKEEVEYEFPFEEDYQHVQQAVSALPMPQRVVVVLYYLNDLSLQEISDILDVPVGTIKSRLYYGREALKKQLVTAQNDRLSDWQIEFT
jgi:RNA polymerase sigma-70 factor, ECF subfamily